jgi:hypothetical protein
MGRLVLISIQQVLYGAAFGQIPLILFLTICIDRVDGQIRNNRLVLCGSHQFRLP